MIDNFILLIVVLFCIGFITGAVVGFFFAKSTEELQDGKI